MLDTGLKYYAVPSWPTPVTLSHKLRNFTLNFLVKVFFYFSVMETTWADSWSDLSQPCRIDFWVIKWRSAWPIFHGPVILPYILKTVWCMNIILRDYESVWPQNKCRSLWPVFHGPVILSYILKTVWSMNIRLWDYESVWHNIWPQSKCRSLWPIFHGPVILPYVLKTIWYMNTILWDYESVWPNVWSQNICRTLWQREKRYLSSTLYFPPTCKLNVPN